eukprot:TRINITY_DN4997_c0_g1_i4.p1 TRINITY_DN4997_c0_g1~~TRINITY_DN4997_c0_g1_i4.p1  ORF type:complete len:190 (+),score=43.03 TRINITY_DN4997_c0_g1_i4:101-670(+)
MVHSSAVTALRLMRCGQRFASGSLDHTAAIWRIQWTAEKSFAKCEKEIIIRESGPILSLNSSQNYANLIILGMNNRKIKVYDVNNAQLQQELEGNQTLISELVLLENREATSIMEDFFILTTSSVNDISQAVSEANHRVALSGEELPTSPKMQLLTWEAEGKNPELRLIIINNSMTEGKGALFYVYRII